MSRPELDRRTFVAATGAVGALALAGCTDDDDGAQPEEEPPDEEESPDEEEPPAEEEPTDEEESPDEEEPPAEEEPTDEEEPPDEEEEPPAEEEDTDGETYSLAVTVEDDAGDPIEGARVVIGETEAVDEEGADAVDEEDETDADGQVEFDDLEDGEYTVGAEYEDGQAEDEVQIDGADEELTLTLEEAAEGGENGDTSGESDGEAA